VKNLCEIQQRISSVLVENVKLSIQAILAAAGNPRSSSGILLPTLKNGYAIPAENLSTHEPCLQFNLDNPVYVVCTQSCSDPQRMGFENCMLNAFSSGVG